MRAVSALDVALWDALGQAVGLPVHQLLGGACRESVPAYNTCVNAGPYQDWDLAITDPGALASQLSADGYLGMKVWPWDRFAPQIEASGSTGPAGWTAMGPPGSYLSKGDLAAGLAMLEPEQGGLVWVLDQADKALYRAKRQGRNRIEQATPQAA